MPPASQANGLTVAFLVGLIVLAFGLQIWLIRFPGRLRAEYRPPFGLSGPLDFLRFDF